LPSNQPQAALPRRQSPDSGLDSTGADAQVNSHVAETSQDLDLPKCQMQFYTTNVTRRLRGAAAALPHWLRSLGWLGQPTPTHTSTMAEIRVHPLRALATEEDTVKNTPTCQGGDRPITSRCPYKEIGRRV